jgi:hypothetical protein
MVSHPHTVSKSHIRHPKPSQSSEPPNPPSLEFLLILLVRLTCPVDHSGGHHALTLRPNVVSALPASPTLAQMRLHNH